MKTYDQSIEVKVPVQGIAEQLRATLKDDEKHADAIAETIIDTLLDNGRINYLYNTLNGYSNDINFKVGDAIICKDTFYGYNNRDQAQAQRHEIGLCEVVEIDIYRSSKLKVKYTSYNNNVLVEDNTEWVNHKRCNKLEMKEHTAMTAVDEVNLSEANDCL